MFTYQKIVDHICNDSVDKDSLSIIKEYSVFYTEKDNNLIFKYFQNYIIDKYDKDFFYFLLFNLKSLQIFKICQDNLSVHYRKNKFFDFYLLEDETHSIIKSFFSNKNTNDSDIKFFINKFFWKHILTDRFEFINNPRKWDYLENSRIFIKNFLIIKMNMTPIEMDGFLNFVLSNFDFTHFHFKKFNTHFNSNLITLDFSFGNYLTDQEKVIEELMSLSFN